MFWPHVCGDLSLRPFGTQATMVVSPMYVGVYQQSNNNSPRKNGVFAMYLTKTDRTLNHQSVMAAFERVETDQPRSALGILFRVDGTDTIIQSNVPPQAIKGAIVQPYTPTMVANQRFAFRVAINAVARKDSKERNVEPEGWFAVRDLGAAFEIRGTQHDPFLARSSNGGKLLVNRWLVEGILTVTDAEKLTQSIKQGLGRGKAWGCGLLSIVALDT
jgi:CRISPR system Cascade subunit CasE